MSSITWRSVFSYNKFIQITARALRISLLETHRLAAEKRGITALRYQEWDDGVGGTQVMLHPVLQKDPKKNAVV